MHNSQYKTQYNNKIGTKAHSKNTDREQRVCALFMEDHFQRKRESKRKNEKE